MRCGAGASAGARRFFADTVRVLARAPEKLLTAWRQIEITYTTERVVHYGGSFTAPLITEHPENGSKILRFAEPVFDLNPVQLSINGLSYFWKPSSSLTCTSACVIRRFVT